MQAVAVTVLSLVLGSLVVAWVLARHHVLQEARRALPGIMPLCEPELPPARRHTSPQYILSIQSGGTHVLASLRYLQRLHAVQPGFVANSVTCFAGTSMGSVAATLLAMGYSPTQILQLVAEEAPHTLHRSLLWRMLTLEGVHQPLFGTTRMQKWVEVVYGDTRLGQLQRRVVVPATQNNGEITVYHNFPGSPHMHRLVRDVVMASCAAPIMLPPHKRHLDGALFAPNPGLHALMLVLQHHPHLSLNRVGMLCLGTHTQQKKRMPPKPGLWWYITHARQAIDLAIQSNRQSIHSHLLGLLGDRCCIVDIPIPPALASAWDGTTVTQLVNVGSQQPLVLPWLDRIMVPSM